MLKPPARSGRSFEGWCWEMDRRGFTAWEMAQTAGVTETRVTQALSRARADAAAARDRAMARVRRASVPVRLAGEVES